MKLSNFVLTHTIGKDPLDRELFAQVDVTTGFLWFKKTTKKIIFRKYLGCLWRFMDTGQMTPDNQAEDLERAWRAMESYGSAQEAVGV